MMRGERIPVAVTVWVEEGVAPLVCALNELPGVVTVASSEGGPEQLAYVRFRRCDGDVAELAVAIGSQLAEHASSLGYELRTRVTSGRPVLELACTAHQVLPLALAVRAFGRAAEEGRVVDPAGHGLGLGAPTLSAEPRLRSVSAR